MQRYKDLNGQIYAYDEDIDTEFLTKEIAQFGLIKLTKEEEEALFAPKEIDKHLEALYELEREIKGQEELIRNALLIGNDRVLPELRDEYKELLAQKQELEKENK